jgi:beta-glucuronidase
MLRPQDNVARETKRLDGLWDFVVDFAGVGREECWWAGALDGGQTMPVPSSYNDVLVDMAVHDHVGDVWYQRTAFVPRGWTGMRTVLRFDAATHRAMVWVGDLLVLEHEGGVHPVRGRCHRRDPAR